MHELSRTDARRIAVRAQLLDAERPASLLDAVGRLTLLHIDPTAAVAPSADLVAWTRRWRGQAELEDGWARRGITPKIVYRTDDNLALQRLVAAGLGHACIGRVAASRAVDPALTWLEPDEATAQRTIAVCYARHRPLTATARTLITAIRAQAAWALSAPTGRSGR